MENPLTLSGGTAAATARVKPISGMSPAQSLVRSNLSTLRQQYKALTMVQKSGWQNVANILNAQGGKTGRHKTTPSGAFVKLNAGLLAVNAQINLSAPSNLTPPPALPPMTLNASLSGGFVLQVLTTPFNYFVEVLAAPPAPAGKNTYPTNSFKHIGAVDSLSSSPPVDLAGLYVAKYGTPETGSLIALRLVATSNAGVRTSPLVVTAVVSFTGESDAPALEMK